LPGRHQFDNAGAAIAALRVIPGLNLGSEKISTALGKIRWPARLQKMQHPDFIEIIGEDSELWLDGGHNDSAGMILGTHIKDWRKSDPKPVHMVVGMLARKNPVEFMNPAVPYIASLTSVPVPGEESSFSPQDLLKLLTPLPIASTHVAESVHSALRGIQARDPGAKRILIAGSLYLAGHVLSAITKP
jgi:dihydrofolate synthase/folylpolyglutamate synthase